VESLSAPVHDLEGRTGEALRERLGTLRDDVDWMHLRLGFMAAIPHMALTGSGEVFRGRGLRHALSPDEVRAAAHILLGTDHDRAPAAAVLADLSVGSRARVLRVLVESGWWGRSAEGLGLTPAWRERVAEARGLRGA